MTLSIILLVLVPFFTWAIIGGEIDKAHEAQQAAPIDVQMLNDAFDVPTGVVIGTGLGGVNWNGDMRLRVAYEMLVPAYFLFAGVGGIIKHLGEMI